MIWCEETADWQITKLEGRKNWETLVDVFQVIHIDCPPFVYDFQIYSPCKKSIFQETF